LAMSPSSQILAVGCADTLRSWAAALDPADLAPGDAKAREALSRFRLAPVTSATESIFDEAYAVLDAEFGVRGELERRSVVAGWLTRGAAQLEMHGPTGETRPLSWRYHLLVARDASSGAIAGVRDCHVTVEVARGTGVVYLAHTIVLPAYRRGGLASLFR